MAPRSSAPPTPTSGRGSTQSASRTPKRSATRGPSSSSPARSTPTTSPAPLSRSTRSGPTRGTRTPPSTCSTNAHPPSRRTLDRSRTHHRNTLQPAYGKTRTAPPRHRRRHSASAIATSAAITAANTSAWRGCKYAPMKSSRRLPRRVRPPWRPRCVARLDQAIRPATGHGREKGVTWTLRDAIPVPDSGRVSMTSALARSSRTGAPTSLRAVPALRSPDGRGRQRSGTSAAERPPALPAPGGGRLRQYRGP